LFGGKRTTEFETGQVIWTLESGEFPDGRFHARSVGSGETHQTNRAWTP
jgi:hypothetical protein